MDALRHSIAADKKVGPGPRKGVSALPSRKRA
jgi:hypothetical protein